MRSCLPASFSCHRRCCHSAETFPIQGLTRGHGKEAGKCKKCKNSSTPYNSAPASRLFTYFSPSLLLGELERWRSFLSDFMNCLRKAANILFATMTLMLFYGGFMSDRVPPSQTAVRYSFCGKFRHGANCVLRRTP